MIDTITVTNKVMRLDMTGSDYGIKASVWIDLKTKKPIRAVEDDVEMIINSGKPWAVPSHWPPPKLEALQNKADTGDPEGMFQLGAYHERRLELTEARDWYEKAADLGNAHAMTALGNMYGNRTKEYVIGHEYLDPMTGLMVPWTDRTNTPDYIESKKWYEMAIKAGDTNAESQLKSLINLKP